MLKKSRNLFFSRFNNYFFSNLTESYSQFHSQKALRLAVNYKSSVPLVRALIEAGSDPNEKDLHKWKQTILHSAASRNPKVVPTLLQHGAKVNILDHSNHSPLYKAAYHKTAKKDKLGRTSLEGQRDAVVALMKAGANPELGINPTRKGNYYIKEDMRQLI